MNRWVGNPLLRLLPFLVGLCFISIELLYPRVALALLPIDNNTGLSLSTVFQVDSMTLPSSIFRRWTHSHEEDQANILVYRPQDYLFPPARGREGLEFRKNGEFIRYQIAPTDGSLAIPGQWSVQNTGLVEVKFPNQSTSSYAFTILECDEQILKIR